YQAQQARSRHENGTGRRNRNNPDFPLKNVACCPQCHNNLTGSRSKGRSQHYAYYHCTRCRAPSIKKADLENAFINKLKEIQLNSQMNKLFLLVLGDTWQEEQQDNIRALSKLT